MVYFHCERVYSKVLSHFVWLGLGMHQANCDCFRIIVCSDNFPLYVIEIFMKYSLFSPRVFAHNVRNIKCLLWAAACEIY